MRQQARDDKYAKALSEPFGSLTFLMAGRRRERRRFRMAVTVAVLVHVVAFMVNWPTMAEPTPTEPPKQILRPIKIVTIIPPEPAPRAPQPTTPPVKVPMPGPPVAEAEDELLPVPIEVPEIDPGTIPVPGPVIVAPPPPPEPEVPEEVWVGVDVSAPEVLHRVEPAYTAAAQRAGIEGIVILELVIDKAGTVVETKALKGLPLGLTENAMAAVAQWRFAPSTVRGIPVSVRYVLTINYEITRA
jgi:protein TonB